LVEARLKTHLGPPEDIVNDMNTRGSGLGGDPIFGELFAQKAKGWYTN